MTISTQTRTAGPFTGTGLVVPYPFSFKIFQASDLFIAKTDASGNQTTWVLGGDYTVALNGDQNAAPGGVVTPLAALAVGSTISMTSNVPLTQGASLTNAGGFFPKTIEDALDRLTILMQQQGFVSSAQALRVPEIGGVPALANATSRAGNLLGFDSLGNPVAVAPVNGSAASLALSLASSAGATFVGWIRSATGAVVTTVANWLGWQPLSAFEFMTPAQIADVQAGTLTQDVTTALQAWATAGIGKRMRAPAGKYKHTAAINYGSGSTIEGDGIAATMFYTALDIEQVNAVAGAYNVTFKDIGFYNTFPVSNVAGPTPTGTIAIGSPQITAVSSVAGLYKGMAITGAGIPAGSFIRKFTTGPNVIYLGDSAGVAVNATANTAGLALTTQFRQGQTHFHAHVYNGGHWLFENCYFKSSFTDTDFSPNNHAGIWFDRASVSAYFINTVENCWVDHGQILMGTSDSNLKSNHVWANPFEYAVKLSAPNISVVGNNISAGVTYGGIWAKASATEPSGALNHDIVGNNIDGGDIWYTGYGLVLDGAQGIVLSGNRINGCFKAGLYANDTLAVASTGNTYFNNNRDGLGYSDIEISSTAGQTVGFAAIGNVFFQSSAQAPTLGYAIKEINNGFYPANCVYANNTVTLSANYQSPAFLIATPLSSGQYPKISGNAGGSTETESTANATTNQSTGTLTGCTTSPTASFIWSRQGNLITLLVPNLAGASNSVACTITGAIPAAILPNKAQLFPALIVISGNNLIGWIRIEVTGVITISANSASGAFANDGLGKGVNTCSITYQLLS